MASSASIFPVLTVAQSSFSAIYREYWIPTASEGDERKRTPRPLTSAFAKKQKKKQKKNKKLYITHM